MSDYIKTAPEAQEDLGDYIQTGDFIDTTAGKVVKWGAIAFLAYHFFSGGRASLASMKSTFAHMTRVSHD